MLWNIPASIQGDLFRTKLLQQELTLLWAVRTLEEIGNSQAPVQPVGGVM